MSFSICAGSSSKNSALKCASWLMAIGCLSVAALFALQYDKSLNLMDEGYLWYGAQRTALGEVPLRDFMSYDPGRYYVSAAYMGLVGDRGIITLRVVLALVQAGGLITALYVLAKGSNKQDRAFWILAAVVFLTWMIPRHKMFDLSISIVLVAALSWLLERPSNRRSFASGIIIGVVAVMGRNHGLYAGASFVLALILCFVGSRDFSALTQRLLSLGAGVCIGYSPLLIMIVAVPGFAEAFWQSIQFLFQQEATNIPLPVPWPWRWDPAPSAPIETTQRLLIGLFFLALPTFLAATAAGILRTGRIDLSTRPQLAASCLLSIPYTHFAFSRADLSHLAQGIFPMLIGVILVLQNARPIVKWSLGITLLTASMLATKSLHPATTCWETRCHTVQIAQTSLLLPERGAKDVQMILDVVAHHAPHGEPFFAAPFLPGAYAMLERKSPVWEIYALFPRSPDFERKEIERLRNAQPRLVVISHAPIGGPGRSFVSTHPLTQTFIDDHFDLIPEASDASFSVYESRSPRS
ncbi:MAG: hypothetical protein AB7O90_05090 [Hyphomicrobium sp.]